MLCTIPKLPFQTIIKRSSCIFFLSEVLSKILYQVLSNGKPVAVEDVVPPSINELETELRASAQIEVFGAAAVRVRNMYLSGVLLDSQRSSVEAAIQASWTASNGKI